MMTSEKLTLPKLPPDCLWESGFALAMHKTTEPGAQEVETRTFLCASWLYKKFYFNPWIQEKLFAMYLESKGLQERVGTKLTIVGVPDYRWVVYQPGFYSPYGKIELGMASDDLESLAFFSSIVEDYCVHGFHPGEKTLRELLLQYTPVRVEKEEYWSGYHDEEDASHTFFNANGENFATIRNRDDCGCGLVEFLEKNTGESQVFGLHMGASKGAST